MEFDCIDDILIFLTELDSNFIAKIGEERVKIEDVWNEEMHSNI